MKHADAVSLFHQMHPGFFDRSSIQALPSEQWAEEMILDLHGDFPCARTPDGEVTFGFWDGEDLPALHAAVREVIPEWTEYFRKDSRCYCAFAEGKIVSFCLMDDMGTHELNGKKVRVAGPGCVGTIPSFRRRGVGLKMIENATRIFRDSGYDYSYIHYTGVAPWYAKLGYEVILRWTRDGLMD